MTRRIVPLLLSLVALGACANTPSSETRKDAPPPPPVAAAAPTALSAAHTAYLEGDFLAVGERIRDVLLDPSSSDLVKENAYELLEKSHEATSGKMPSTFTLPDGYVNLQYGAIRGATTYAPFYRIFVRGRARDASHLTNVTLRRLPDGEVLLDKASGKGVFDLRDDEPGYKDFVLELKDMKALPADGVFSIRLAFDNGAASEGWFIGHGLSSSASPDVKSPLPAASLSDPNPVVSWVPFRSPEYAAFEARTFNVWLGRDGDPGFAWNFWTGDPGDLEQVRVGAHPGAPKTKLAAGDYWLNVGAWEIRMFGPVRLVRGSSTGLPFHVVP